MSSATAVRYTVEQRAALDEAANLRREESRLEVAREDRRRLERELAVFEELYGVGPSVPSAPKTTGRETSVQLREIVDSLESAISRVEGELDGERDRLRRQRLAERLRAVISDVKIPVPAVPTTKATDSALAAELSAAEPEDAADRARRYLSQLDPGAELSDVFLELSETLLRAEVSAHNQIAADALQAEIGRLNRELREHARTSQALRDLRVRAGAIEPRHPGLDALIAASVDAHQRRQPVDLGPIAEAISAAEEERRQVRDAAYVSAVVVDILSTLGYEQVGGFDTVVPEHGAILRRPDWSDHGVLVRVDNEEVNLLVVRTATDVDAAAARVEDVAAENAFCVDLPAVLEQFVEHGISTGVQRQVPPDTIKVRTLAGAPPSPKPAVKRRVRKATPKAKTL